MGKANKYSYKLLIITLLLGLIGLISLFLLSWTNNRIDKVQKNISKIVKSNLGNEQNPITNNMDKKVKKYVNGNKNIKGVQIRILQYSNQDEKIMYSFPYNIDFHKSFAENSKGQLFMQPYNFSSTINIPNSSKSVVLEVLFMDLKINYLSLLNTIALTSIVAYWILFTVWGALRILKNKESIVWILVVFVSNLFGYLLYYLLREKINFKNKKSIIPS